MSAKPTAKRTRGEWLRSAVTLLTSASVPSARLDALVLLEDATGLEKSSLLAHLDEALSPDQQRQLDENVTRRQRHEPLAYIRGRIDFYGRSFTVNPQVLVPRPESETMITLLISLTTDSQHKIADVGCGSGALGITAALECPISEAVHFIDIDPACLATAESNARHYGVNGQYHQADLLAEDQGSYDVILANLPYVPDAHTINAAAMIEPAVAIFGGPDGLDLYRRLFQQLAGKSWSPQFVLTEALPFQHQELVKIAAANRYKLLKTDDLIQVWQPTARAPLPA